MSKTKQVRVHSDMDDFMEEFHQKVINATGTNMKRPETTGILAKGLRQMDVLNNIDVVQVQKPKKRRSSLDLRLDFW